MFNIRRTWLLAAFLAWSSLSPGVFSEENEEDLSVGQRIIQHNRDLKELREELEGIKQEHGFSSEQYKEISEKLQEKRNELDAAVDALEPGQGLRRNIRQNIANDRIAREREQKEYEAWKEEYDNRVLTKREKAEMRRKAEEEAKKKAEAEAKKEAEKSGEISNKEDREGESAQQESLEN